MLVKAVVVVVLRQTVVGGQSHGIETNIPIFSGICVIYGLCFQVFDCDNPLVSDLICVCAEYDVSVVDDVVPFLVFVHCDADKERWPIVVDLIGLDDAVYELELDGTQRLPIDSFLLVVVPSEFIACKCHESWFDLLAEMGPLLVEPFVQDEAFTVLREQVLYAAYI